MTDPTHMRAAQALLRTARVTKRLSPGAPGTKKLLKRHAGALVCVRYRQDPLGLMRFTTIELMVDAAIKDVKRFDRTSFGIALRPSERATRLAAIAAGARWHETDGLWWLRGAALRRLDIIDRIARRSGPP